MPKKLGLVDFAKKIYSIEEIDGLLSAKQDLLTFDDEPVSGSSNPVTSDGIRSAIDEALSGLGKVLRWKGSVPTYEDLPKDGVEVGDVYNVVEDGMNVACAGHTSNDDPVWDPLGPSMDMYLTKDEAQAAYQKKLTPGQGISIDDDAKISIPDGAVTAAKIDQTVLDNLATKADATLTEIAEFSEWIVRANGEVTTEAKVRFTTDPTGKTFYQFYPSSAPSVSLAEFYYPTDTRTSIVAQGMDSAPGVEFSATRTKLSSSYKLGSQSDKPLQPAGDYALKSDIPTVPTNVSAFTNDAGYITSEAEFNRWKSGSSIAAGNDATANSPFSVGIGNKARAAGIKSIAISAGDNSNTTNSGGESSIAIGTFAKSLAAGSIAIGKRAGVDTAGTNSIQLGESTLGNLNTSNTFRYRDTVIVDGNGKIPSANLDKSFVQAVVEKTWSELKALRDGGTLVPGQQYRITDYVATTVQADTQSANHPFDIIVRADSTNKLNENAYAIRHAGDTYFDGCNLEAWELKYCLDNDTNRFAWADSTNGKGVVYRLIDEFGNDCPYDFKGIQFKRWAITNVTSTKISDVSSLVSSFSYSETGKCFAYKGSNISVNGTVLIVDASTSQWHYTFSDIVSGNAVDMSLTASSTVYGNKIGPWHYSVKPKLNGIVFIGSGCNSNTFDNNCYSNTFGSDCYSNTFGSDCSSNTFGSYCNYNTFGSNCSSNTFGSYCNYNTFGSSCSSNTFGGSCSYSTFDSSCSYNTFEINCYSNTLGGNCSYNTFGSDCSSNTLGGICSSNTFGSNCSSNTLGGSCSSNTFGSECYSNTFDNNCLSNTFGSECYSNTFGSDCSSNTFDNNCSSNTFGSGCNYNTFGGYCSSNTFGSYCSSNTFGSDCNYNTFGSSCYSNTFGSSCYANTFMGECSSNAFGTSSATKSYCRWIKMEPGVKNVYLNPTGTTTSSAYFQNVVVCSGVSDKTISDSRVGQTFRTEYRPANSETISV